MRRWLCALLGLVLLSCAGNPPFISRRLDDGTMELQCQKTLPECLAHFEDVCGGDPYEVVSARDLRRPVDIVVGTHQPQARTSDARVRCRHASAPAAPSAAATPATGTGAKAGGPGPTPARVGAGAAAA